MIPIVGFVVFKTADAVFLTLKTLDSAACRTPVVKDIRGRALDSIFGSVDDFGSAPITAPSRTRST